MSENGLHWTGDQWERVRQIVHDEAMRARVAASFLPLYGPLPPGAETVPANALHIEDGLGEPGAGGERRLAVNDHDTLRLASVSVNVYLKNHMAADPELAAATVLFRRAAGIVARAEDAIIFNGKSDGRLVEPGKAENQRLPKVYSLGGAPSYGGLLDHAKDREVPVPRGEGAALGASVFGAVVEAIQRLESDGHFKPFACVLGHNLFHAINTPFRDSMVLARDSILPFLDGPLLRSASLPPDAGLVISLQGEPVEIVVPGDISVRYLQTTLDGRHAFRVSQRFVLRVKDATAIAALRLG